MTAEEFLIYQDGINNGHYDRHKLKAAFNLEVSQPKPYSAIVQSIRDHAFRCGTPCDLAYSVICAMQENCGEWEDSFFGTKEEDMQGRVFCLIVAEALS